MNVMDRMGRVVVTADFIRKEPEKVAKAFAAIGFVPIRVESVDYKRTYEYLGVSSHFDELTSLHEGCIVPLYNLTVSYSGTEIKASVTKM